MSRHVESRPVFVPVNDDELHGDLSMPENSGAIVIFAHGSGSSRHSPRNKYVAKVLNDAAISTLLIDLLTPEEEAADMRTGHLRFNIPLLAQRLGIVTGWLRHQSSAAALHLGYFGASTGAASALVAAGKHPDIVEAVVSRGGRPDLAGAWLMSVHAPTLLIVGGEDDVVIDLNLEAAAELRCEHRVEIVPGAGHLFEEPGALEQVSSLACHWFETHLIATHRRVA